MIVYAGKQFWNDFNNGDEALFEDAVLPRDSNKFKIQAWVQSRKQDLRTANTNIAAQAIFYGAKVQDWQTQLTDNDGNWLFNKAYLRNTYTASDISDINGFVTAWWYTYNAANEAPRLNAIVVGNPSANTNNWDVVIGKTWVYAVTAQCAFIAPTWYSPNNSANYKFYVAVLLGNTPLLYTQSRWCGAMDMYSVVYIWQLEAWDRINTWFLHTYTTRAFLCHPAITVLRLS